MTKKDKKKKSLYEELELTPFCTKEDIKKAYRKKMKKVHPDVGGDPEEFKQVQKAYLILSDSESRYKYDSVGEEEKPSDRKPIDIEKQVEMFLIRAIFDIVDRLGEHLEETNIQKSLLESLNSVQKEIANRKNNNKIAWKAVANKYRAVKRKQQSIKKDCTLYNILQQKLNFISTQELMKIRQDHKRLLIDSKIANRCIEIAKTDCIDSYVEKTTVDPLAAWDSQMKWGVNNPYMSTSTSTWTN